jgi:hypothetical protein
LLACLIELSDDALLHFGVPPDERFVTDPRHAAGELNALIEALHTSDRLLETGAALRSWARKALTTVEKDRGGPKPVDRAAMKLIRRLRHRYETATGRRASHGWNEARGRYVGEFSTLVMHICGVVMPSIPRPKADDYLRRALHREPSPRSNAPLKNKGKT